MLNDDGQENLHDTGAIEAINHRLSARHCVVKLPTKCINISSYFIQ